MSISKRTPVYALAALAMLGASSYARADVKDYEFQLVDKTVKKGDATISVRLVHKPDGKPVSDAVIFAKRLDMAPEGMETMKTTIEAMPSQSLASTSSKLPLRWTAAGSCRLVPKFRAKPERSKASSS